MRKGRRDWMGVRKGFFFSIKFDVCLCVEGKGVNREGEVEDLRYGMVDRVRR